MTALLGVVDGGRVPVDDVPISRDQGTQRETGAAAALGADAQPRLSEQRAVAGTHAARLSAHM